MSDDNDDIDILHEEVFPFSPGTPAFLCQQVHLLENLNNSQKHIPTDYQSFVETIKSMKTNYQPAVILATWKILLDNQVSKLGLGEQSSKTVKHLNHESKTLLNKKVKKILNFDDIETDNESVTTHETEEHFFQENVNHNTKLKKTNRKDYRGKQKCSKSKKKRTKDVEEMISEYRHTYTSKVNNSSVHDSGYLPSNHLSINNSAKNNEELIIISDSDIAEENTIFESLCTAVENTNKRKISDINFITKSISCPDIRGGNSLTSSLIEKCTSIESKSKKKKSCSKEKNMDSVYHKKNINDKSSTVKKKKCKLNHSLKEFSSTVLGESSQKRKSKNKNKKVEKNDLDLCGLSKTELIKFFKEQKREKVAEEKLIERQMLEMYHDRLVDVIIPKYFTFNNKDKS